MDAEDFFNKDKPLVRVQLPSAQIGGDLEVDTEKFDEYVEPEIDENVAFDYAQKYKDEEEQLYIENTVKSQENEILRPDSPTTVNSSIRDTNEISENASSIVFEKYNFDKHITNNLSINMHKDEIKDSIESNCVVIIQGPTGCGKTTQVPQYIMDHCQKKGAYCKIAVTQPRRIAAISIAKRVSEERGWPLNTIVGYQVALDNKTSEDTVLTYMTTGVLLQKLIKNKNLNQFTHIIIDEVHERDAEMDFLLLIVRRFLRTHVPYTKVILMSATFDVNHFSSYFVLSQRAELFMTPIIDVTKQQPYVVNIYYLNQFDRMLNTEAISFDEPLLHKSLFKTVVKLIHIFNTFDCENPNNKLGSVLIFLPGIYDIEEMYETLRKENEKVENTVKWFIVPLHSSITIEEQRKVFVDAPVGQRKIILSTNIAESSITVPDVYYVIDFCLTKILINDPKTNYTSLKLVWASHTNCQQRSGRVGRVAAGRVYRLVTQKFYDERMQRDTEPEILRSPLQRLVLLSKMLELNLPPQAILALAIDPPALHNIEKTIALLKETGALKTTSNGVYDTQDGDLTQMGRIMSQLPLDIHITKLIIFGHMFSVLKECIIMGTAISLQNIFSTPFNEKMKAYQSKLTWADCSLSDLISYLHVYCVWEKNKFNNSFQRPDAEKKWMKRNHLQPRIMREWRILVQEIKTRLSRLGITDSAYRSEGNWTEQEKAVMLKVVICGAFYPNYFVRSSEGGQVDESLAVRQLGGRDPYNTVYLTGKPANQPVELYMQSIRELLKCCGHNMIISHDNTSKIFIQFKHDMIPSGGEEGKITLIPGKIAAEVYFAVKYRHSKLPTTIRCVSAEEANLRVKQWKKNQLEMKKKVPECIIKSIIPGYESIGIEIEIAFVNNPGHFFAHNVENKKIKHWLEKIESELNSNTLQNINDDVIDGKVYAAPYENVYYRARVVCVMPTNYRDLRVQVLFIDYGNIECVQKSQLKYLLPDLLKIPPLAIECVLTGVQPSHRMNIHALWSEVATKEFIRKTTRGSLFGKVYSVVDNIVSIELYLKNARGKIEELSINEWLIRQGFAIPAIESFLSQADRKKREFVQNSETDVEMQKQDIEWYDKENEMTSPQREECRFSMNLNGPFSPLEMKVFSVVQSSIYKNINVEWNSVNSVLLDTDPQDPHDRLIVAGTVTQTGNEQSLILRHTTMMPNILGFPVLMSLIFCPKMELHTDKDGTRLTSILCGLGYDPETNKSLYPSHDIALNLDFELTDDEITKVNEIRYYMNSGVLALSEIDSTETGSPIAIETCQNEIRNSVRQLLNRNRKPLERIVLPDIYKWNKRHPDVEVTRPLYADVNDIWTMHSSLKLLKDNHVVFRRNLEQLKDMAINDSPITEITCLICNIVLYDTNELRVHLVSRLHKENEKSL